MKLRLFKNEPWRQRERLEQFIAITAAVLCILILRYLVGINWAILAGIVTYFVVGITMSKKLKNTPTTEQNNTQKKTDQDKSQSAPN